MGLGLKQELVLSFLNVWVGGFYFKISKTRRQKTKNNRFKDLKEKKRKEKHTQALTERERETGRVTKKKLKIGN